MKSIFWRLIDLISISLLYLVSLSFVTNSPELRDYIFPLQVLPFVLVIMFGLYAATTVLYRTLTFNDCPEAAKELQQQIEEARKDLIAKGFKFRD